MEVDLLLAQALSRAVGDSSLSSVVVFAAKYLPYAVAGFVAIFLLKERERFAALFWQLLLAALLSRLVFTETIRLLWDRSRPFVEQGFTPLVEHVASPSFPSGHAAFFFAIAAVVYGYNKKVGAALFVASILIGVARVAAGLHWPSDILAGALVGVASAWIVRRFTFRAQ